MDGNERRFQEDQIRSIKQDIELFMKIYNHADYVELDHDYKIVAYISSMDSLYKLANLFSSIGIKAKNIGLVLNTYGVDKFDCFDISNAMHDIKSHDDFNIEYLTILEYETLPEDEMYIMMMKQHKHEPKLIDSFSISIK